MLFVPSIKMVSSRHYDNFPLNKITEKSPPDNKKIHILSLVHQEEKLSE